MSNKENKNTGINILTILTLINYVLKLTGHINWSWWLVLAPLWIPTVTVVVIAIIWTIVEAIIN